MAEFVSTAGGTGLGGIGFALVLIEFEKLVGHSCRDGGPADS